MASEKAIPEEIIQSKIYFVRDQKVMIDSDLAKLYGVETKRVNEQVRRNLARFPDDFMFQLSTEEWENLKSQNATSRWGGRRKNPYAFTEHGILMLSSVLSSEKAIAVNIHIMRVYTRMREMLFNHGILLKEIERVKQKTGANSNNIEMILTYLKQLEKARQNEQEQKQRRQIGYRVAERKL